MLPFATMKTIVLLGMARNAYSVVFESFLYPLDFRTLMSSFMTGRIQVKFGAVIQYCSRNVKNEHWLRTNWRY